MIQLAARCAAVGVHVDMGRLLDSTDWTYAAALWAVLAETTSILREAHGG